jgi:hypothetical protein
MEVADMPVDPNARQNILAECEKHESDRSGSFMSAVVFVIIGVVCHFLGFTVNRIPALAFGAIFGTVCVIKAFYSQKKLQEAQERLAELDRNSERNK